MQTERIAISHPMQRFSFVGATIADAVTTTLWRVATSAAAKIDAKMAVMPYPGSVVALAIASSAAKVDGDMIAQVEVNNGAVGTDILTAPVADGASSAYSTVKAGLIRFNAGDTLGADVNCSADLNPPDALDVAVDVYVIFDEAMV